ncbi:peptidylprolyl isomerase [Sutcliffiella horikoshii]|uniref:peptidylprolyl isomerase n=1 Tax=Sutcliffiella horikoshii TaxID=79883 RepID=UPI001F21AF0C|nr:peptidylprolyl isomerase [Sutcliffiella horikoshii]MCG1022455.1 peptidylprolyl isomerase [Sutcliffiella horikoshii]
MKKWIIAASTTAALFALSACNNDSDDSNVIAETSAGNITQAEFYDAMKERFGEEVLRELVFEKVLNKNYDVSDEEVQERLEELKMQLGPEYDAAMEQSGFKNEDQLIKTLRLSMLQEKAAMENVEVSEEEIQQHYDEMKHELRASHILVEDEETATEVKKKLDEGADFAELATEYSTDTGSAQNGGDLEWFGSGDMLTEFEEAAYSLEINEVSEPVESMYGFHIIKVTDKKEKPPLEEIKEEVEQEILQNKLRQEDPGAVLEKEIEAANVKIKDSSLKNTFEQEKEQELE